MSDYISREAVLALAKDICVPTKWDSEYRHRSIDPLDVIELPAADVRPVVLCRDCQYFENDCGWCGCFGIGMNVNDFCSQGEMEES